MTLPFENDTGPVIKRLAARSIQTDKRRNLFVIVTIALAAALMAAIFCAGAGNDRKLEADLRGQYQAVVVNCDRDTIEKLKDCPEVERWGLSQNYGSARYGQRSDCGVCGCQLDGIGEETFLYRDASAGCQ